MTRLVEYGLLCLLVTFCVVGCVDTQVKAEKEIEQKGKIEDIVTKDWEFKIYKFTDNTNGEVRYIVKTYGETHASISK